VRLEVAFDPRFGHGEGWTLGEVGGISDWKCIQEKSHKYIPQLRVNFHFDKMNNYYFSKNEFVL
jgi:hypothetical protein